MAKWKKFDQIDDKFFNFTKPTQPAGAAMWGSWKLADTFNLENLIVKHNPEYTANYTKLADPKDAARLADSLASRFGYTSLVGTLGKWSGYYEVKAEGDKVIAKYNLESVFHSDYKRHVEYVADNKTGDVTIKYVCDEAVPEKVIAKDLQKLYKTLIQRKGYFVKNAPAVTPGTTPATTTTTQTTTAPATPTTPAPPANAGGTPQITYAGMIDTQAGPTHSVRIGEQLYGLVPIQAGH